MLTASMPALRSRAADGSTTNSPRSIEVNTTFPEAKYLLRSTDKIDVVKNRCNQRDQDPGGCVRVRADIIGLARIKYVGKYQACMVLKGRLIPQAS